MCGFLPQDSWVKLLDVVEFFLEDGIIAWVSR